MLLFVETASGERNAFDSCSIVIVACSANSHFPPFVIKFTDASSRSPRSASTAADASPALALLLLLAEVAGAPQNTAIRPEQELLVTCMGIPTSNASSHIG